MFSTILFKNSKVFLLLTIFLFSFSSCASAVRNSEKFEPPTNVNEPSRLRQNIRVLIDEEVKPFRYKIDISSFISEGDQNSTRLIENEEISLSASKGVVSVSTSQGTFSAATVKLKPAGKEEFLNFRKKTYRGELWFVAQNSKVFVINYLDIEDYLLGVVPLEIGLKDNYFYEALKCAAVTARTFAINRLSENRALYDVTDGVKDQAYGGMDVETGIDSRSVIETQGLILTYKGKPALVFYSANCGGYTEDIANVFGPVDVPYLKGVQDGDPPNCKKSPSFKWSESYTAFEIVRYLFDSKIIRSTNYVLDGLEIKERYRSGRAKELIIHLAGEKPVSIPGSKIRDVIKSKKDNSILRSSNFEIELVRKNGVLSKINLSGFGNGHGVGMCQWGALNLSRGGTPYQEILEHFFPGTQLTQAYDN